MFKTLITLSAIGIISTMTLAQDISGTYYVGEPNYDASLEHPWQRGADESYEITYNKDDYSIDLVYKKGERPMHGVPHQLDMPAVKRGEYYVFTMSNVGPNCFINADMLQIEPGIFVVAPATTAGMDGKITRAVKSSAPSKGGKVYPVESLVREFIIGKDKERVKYLCEHPNEFEPLLYTAVETRKASQNSTNADSHPKPNEGMTDASMKKEALSLIKDWSVAKKWPQTVASTYIKSTDWETLKSGKIVTARQITCVVIMSSNGNCQWKEYLIRQDYTNGAYGKSYVFGELPGGYATDCK